MTGGGILWRLGRLLAPSHLKSCKPVHERHLSTGTSGYAVYVSTCFDVFQNLAFEDWVYSNVRLAHDNGVLFLWRNKPCIVIGRHQNPWAECDVHLALSEGVSVARRRSGGGTVYHDMGNLNCTFMTSRKKYDRRVNLEILANTLIRRWGFDVKISDRDDLILDDTYKISGTASKLGDGMAYHHCTLLCDVNKTALHRLLCSKMEGLESRATTSVPSPVKNLSNVDSSATCEDLMFGVAEEYLIHYKSQFPVQYIDPSKESIYQGIHKLDQDLRSWEWIFGKTPKFSIHNKVTCLDTTVDISVIINKGMIEDVRFKSSSSDVSKLNFSLVRQCVLGVHFWPSSVQEALKNINHDQGASSVRERELILSVLKTLVGMCG